MNAIGVQPADFVVAPEVTSFDLSEFTRAEEMACIGETITNAAAEELHRMLEKLDSKLFGEFMKSGLVHVSPENIYDK